MNKVFVVEDDRDISALLCEHLASYGFSVISCVDFSNVLGEFRQSDADIVLMDVNLPVYNGFYWCGCIRQVSSCPLLFLSARTADSDQVYAMSNGGDDFITKPFSVEVLVAKINALLRRAYGVYSNDDADELRCEDCVFSLKKLSVTCIPRSAELSKTEAAIVRIMFSAYPNVVPREKLLSEIWDDETFVEENTLNVTISRVRKKLAAIGSSLSIKPVRGVGYRLVIEGCER